MHSEFGGYCLLQFIFTPVAGSFLYVHRRWGVDLSASNGAKWQAQPGLPFSFDPWASACSHTFPFSICLAVCLTHLPWCHGPTCPYVTDSRNSLYGSYCFLPQIIETTNVEVASWLTPLWRKYRHFKTQRDFVRIMSKQHSSIIQIGSCGNSMQRCMGLAAAFIFYIFFY